MASVTKHWKDVVAEKPARQAATIPEDWILSGLPPKETINVIDFQEKCGLLNAKEVDITNSEADVLLKNMAKGLWSAVEVATAFSKRAVVAHQLVRPGVPFSILKEH